MAAAKTQTKAKKLVPKHTLEAHPFNPGDKVEAHVAQDNDYWRRNNQEPSGKAAGSATVTKDGTLAFSGLKKGRYYAVSKAPVGNVNLWQRVGPGLNDDADAEVTEQHTYVEFSVKK